MTVLTAPFVMLTLLFLNNTETSFLFQETPDTSMINEQSRKAYFEARRNPDVTIYMAHQSLRLSRKTGYSQGLADASLALGMAYLAKYNKGDSAYFYNKQALDIYEETGNVNGIARACYGLAYVYSFKSSLDESEKYATLALKYFEEAGDSRGMINSLNVLSYLARQQRDLDKARVHIEKAIATAREVKDTLPLANALNDLGNLYKEMALNSQAIDKYFEALRLWELKNDLAGISIAYGSIGLAYFYQKDFDKALEYTKKHFTLSEKRGDLWEMSKMCNNIAQIFTSINLHDSAMVYHRMSLRLNREMSIPSGEANACYVIASTFLNLRQTDSAFWYIRKAFEISSSHELIIPPEYYVTIGKIQLMKGNYRLAADNCLKAYSLAKEKEVPLIVSSASLLLSEIYARSDRENLAYKYLKEHMQLKDSISNDEFLTQITRMEIQYDFDKKQKAAEYAQMQERMVSDNKIKQQSLYLKGLLILLAIVALFSLLIIRHNQLRARYAHIDLEQRLLRAQMNPHFIFNSLCAVQDFILSGKSQKANTFLTKIARLMRNILENSREEFISLNKEIETLKLYLDVQQLRFETGFDYEIAVQETIDPENVSVPPMLAQPCVENSIEHGLLPSGEKGKISICYTLKDGLIMLEVTDNGVGRRQAASAPEGIMKKQSVSTGLTEKRLAHFRRTMKEKNISYNISDLYDADVAAGTKVVMMLPYRKIYA